MLYSFFMLSSCLARGLLYEYEPVKKFAWLAFYGVVVGIQYYLVN